MVPLPSALPPPKKYTTFFFLGMVLVPRRYFESIITIANAAKSRSCSL
jgi:hypothetical protein